jgi:hypothetical protein
MRLGKLRIDDFVVHSLFFELAILKCSTGTPSTRDGASSSSESDGLTGGVNR